MQYLIKYNTAAFPLDLKTGESIVISHTEPIKNISAPSFLRKLNDYFISVSLTGKKILVVVSDKTRLCGYPDYLPVLDYFLKENKTYKIDYIIAYGTHKKQTEGESLKAYGAIYKKYDFLHPDQDELLKYKVLGETVRGTRVKVREELFQYDLIIGFGALSHHYFAGFGGGRKLLFPGLAKSESIYQNHSLFLNKVTKKLHDKCKPGVLTNNPLAEDLKEISGLLPNMVCLHGILNTNGELCDIEITNSYNEFVSVCVYYDGFFAQENVEKYNTVLASCGGYPKDINFIQSHKGIHHAAEFVNDGGDLIIFAGCADGIGSDTFLPYFEMGYEKAFESLAFHYKGNGGTALSMMEKVNRLNIYMVTLLPEEYCKLIGIKKITETEALTKFYKAKDKAFLPNASMVIKKDTAGL